MLSLVKLALRISGSAFDAELNLLIADCIDELTHLGVIVATTDGVPTSPQIQTTVIAYCKWKFGNNEDKDQWRDIYHTKLGQLQSMTGYTDWGE